MKSYDYLIVGAGLFGATFAWKMSEFGKRCVVIDKRAHIGGNCYTENVGEVNVHKYGPHIFHCTDTRVWDHVNQFAVFNNFTYRPKVAYGDKLYSFPINLMTLYQIYGVRTPEEGRRVLDTVKVDIPDPKNLEEWCLSQVGHELYQTFIYGYTKKQWGREPKELPASIIKRIPIRLTFNDNYFNDKHQGIPIGGYTPMFKAMLENVQVHLNVDYFHQKEVFDSWAEKVLFTGMIDEYYDYQLGELEYRGLSFEQHQLSVPDFQGNAAVNYTAEDVPYTRIIEHSHFQMESVDRTVITYEKPANFKRGDIPYYPVGDHKNIMLYDEYRQMADKETNVIFGGRLASYKYWDMHQTIPAALRLAERELQLNKCFMI